MNEIRDLCGDRNALCLEYTNANIVTVMLNYYFAKYYHLGKLGKEYMESLYIISYNCIFMTILK